MAASTVRPSVTPLVSWDKTQQQAKPAAKKSNPLLMVIAIAVVLLLASGLFRMLHKPNKGQWVEVVAARGDIPAGCTLGITNVTFTSVPKQFCSSDMIVSLNNATGRVTRSFIPAGEPIKNFMVFQGHESLSGNLETHERAITLKLDDDALVDHAIMPDDRVDILVVSTKNDKKYTKTICQAVRVLMTSSRDELIRHHGSNNNKITLALTPDMAEIVNEAAETGKIRLALRSRLSRIEQKLAGVGPDQLFPAAALESPSTAGANNTIAEISQPQLPPPPGLSPVELQPAAPPNPIQWMVEVISGNHKDTYAVPQQ